LGLISLIPGAPAHVRTSPSPNLHFGLNRGWHGLCQLAVCGAQETGVEHIGTEILVTQV